MSCLQWLSPFSLQTVDGWTPVLMTQLCCTSTSCWGHDGITENDLVLFLSHTWFALLLSIILQQVNMTSPKHLLIRQHVNCLKETFLSANPPPEPNCGRLLVITQSTEASNWNDLWVNTQTSVIWNCNGLCSTFYKSDFFPPLRDKIIIKMQQWCRHS